MAVFQPEAAVDVHLPGGGVQVGLQAHRYQAGLGYAFKATVLLLVAQLGFFLGFGRGVVVLDVGVVKDEAAGAQHHQRAQPEGNPGGAAPAAAGFGLAAGESRIGAAHPEQVGQQRQQHRTAGPVELEPGETGQEVPVAIHVGVGRAGVAGVVEQLVVDAQLALEQRGQVVHHHHEVAQVLVVHDYLNEHGQHAQQQVVNELDAE